MPDNYTVEHQFNTRTAKTTDRINKHNFLITNGIWKLLYKSKVKLNDMLLYLWPHHKLIFKVYAEIKKTKGPLFLF